MQSLSKLLHVKLLLLPLSVVLAIISPNTLHAVEFTGGSNLVTVLHLPANSVSIRVTGPKEYAYESTSNVILGNANQPLLDGQYSYEITAHVNEPLADIPAQAMRENGRSENSVRQTPSKVVEHGYFRILDGVVVTQDSEESEQ